MSSWLVFSNLVALSSLHSFLSLCTSLLISEDSMWKSCYNFWSSLRCDPHGGEMSTGLVPKAVSFGVTFSRWLPITATYIYIKHTCQHAGKPQDQLG